MTMAATKQRLALSSKDDQCHSLPRFSSGPASPLLHMDECDDPNCIDFEQLHELQASIDQYTDYAHYEKCCDGRHAADDACNGTRLSCCQVSATPTDNCEECVDDCDECLEEHELGHLNDFDALLDEGSPVKCDDDCEKCDEECEEQGHDRKDCPQDHHTSWDSCITTCGMCIDPTPLPLLPGDAEQQLYELNNYMPHITPCDDRCTPPPLLDDIIDYSGLNKQQTAFDVALDHWQTFQQAHHCAPDPCLVDQLGQFQPPQHVDPQFGFSFGCDPTIPGNQYSWQNQDQLPQSCAVSAFGNLDLNSLATNINQFTPIDFNIAEQSTDPGRFISNLTAANAAPQPRVKSPSPSVKTGRACQWLMPCGSICGQTFGRTDDLKKHVKNSHLSLKGTTTCRWGSVCKASFASEAALTGHISKKHLAPLYAAGSATTSKADSKSPAAGSEVTQAEELPWKCTFPGCSKSFMYKQVRDDHAASHTGSNLAHCPICHRWLNAEGSNFRRYVRSSLSMKVTDLDHRHLASHKPEHEHMTCKHSHLG